MTLQDRRPHSAGPPAVLAALDLGSNSFRLEIAQVTPAADGSGRGYRRLAYHKDIVRLGAGLDDDGRLSAVAAQRGLDCMRHFGRLLHGFSAGQVRAVATQTLRTARNRAAFLQQAHALLGFPVEVISGDEEARLIYVGVAHLHPSPTTRLVIDIGGGSTELVLGNGHQVLHTGSFAVGGIGLSLRHFAGGRMTAAAFLAAQADAAAVFGSALHGQHPFGSAGGAGGAVWQQALAASGTAGTVSQLLKATAITDGRITPEALAWCVDHCVTAGHVDKLALLGLEANRRAVLPGGLAILLTLVQSLGIALLLPTKGALRQGVIVDLAQRTQA